MDFLSRITIVCFAGSFSVALLLEVLRLVKRVPLRFALTIGWTVAGLFAHTVYLLRLAQSEISRVPAESALSTFVLSSWYDWCLLAAWGVAAVYLGLLIRRPQSAYGLFLLPLVLCLIAVAVGLADQTPFARASAEQIWITIHGVVLLAGTISVSLGFAAGSMYLLQARRLKQKQPISPRIKLPPLEALQRFNRDALFWSLSCLGIGLLSGIVLNIRLQTTGGSMIAWSDPAVLSSLTLFSWLVLVTIFEWQYRPAREGRKVAYLTIASFVFLVLVLGFVLTAGHGTKSSSVSALTPQGSRSS